LTKLNQIIAIEKGARNAAATVLTRAYQNVQKAAPLSGISRTYQPREDEGERLPAESTRVQLNAANIASEVKEVLARMFDVVATKDNTNCLAKADILVEGRVLVTDVPVSFLLYLEKQLTDLRTFISKLPTLDPSEEWSWDDNALCYVSAPVQTVRSKKVPRNHVLAAATDRHAAQVQVWHEDVAVGTWTTVKRSGALPAREVAEALRRVEVLTAAVKQAREAANMTDVSDKLVGTALVDYVFGV
jgi:hypothetical protein